MLLLLAACASPDSSSKDTADSGGETDTVDTADTGDTGQPPDVWAECPDASAWVGDTAWTGSLVATADALYCSAGNEDRELEDELRTKMMLRVVEGSYAVPTTDGTWELALPICTHTGEDGQAPQLDGPGSTEVSAFAAGGTTYTYIEGSQPLASPDGATWTLEHTVVLVGPEGGEPSPLTLDGAESDPTTGAGAELRLYADGGSAYDADARVFVPCNDPDWTLNTHTVTFDGGEISIEMYVGEDPIGTAPTAFTRAVGTLDGVAFEQTDFFALVYRPGHHNMTREFAVILPSAVGEACALLVQDVDDQPTTQSASASLADCALGVLETRAVTSDTLVVEGG